MRCVRMDRRWWCIASRVCHAVLQLPCSTWQPACMFFRQIHSRLRKTSSGKFTQGIDLAGVSGNICDGAGGRIAMMRDVANKTFFLWVLVLPELIAVDVDCVDIRMI